MTKSLRIPDYLSHILKALERIERYTEGVTETMFLKNELVQDAVIRNIEIVGEASNNIQRTDPAFAAKHKEVPWSVLYTMRNRVTHGYHRVDLEIVWKTIQADLPDLRAQIVELSSAISLRSDFDDLHSAPDPTP